jgi:hypothetical protein
LQVPDLDHGLIILENGGGSNRCLFGCSILCT